jgi:hypothetical protein
MQAESISQKRRETSHQFLSDVNWPLISSNCCILWQKSIE